MANQRHTQTGGVVVYDVTEHVKITEEQIALAESQGATTFTQEQVAVARGDGALNATQEQVAVSRSSGAVHYTVEGIFVVWNFKFPPPRVEVQIYG